MLCDVLGELFIERFQLVSCLRVKVLGCNLARHLRVLVRGAHGPEIVAVGLGEATLTAGSTTVLTVARCKRTLTLIVVLPLGPAVVAVTTGLEVAIATRRPALAITARLKVAVTTGLEVTISTRWASLTITTRFEVTITTWLEAAITTRGPSLTITTWFVIAIATGLEVTIATRRPAFTVTARLVVSITAGL